MKVTIRDRSSEAPWGSSGLLSPCVRTVEIADTCPQCGGKRGEPFGMNQCDDGAYYWVQGWHNPCGHVDHYEAVAREAKALAEKAGA